MPRGSSKNGELPGPFHPALEAFFAITFAILGVVWLWDNHPLLLTLLLASIAAIAWYVMLPWWRQLPFVVRGRLKTRQEQVAAEEAAAIEQAKQAYMAAHLPTAEVFRNKIGDAYRQLARAANQPLIIEECLVRLLGLFGALYEAEFPETFPAAPDRRFLLKANNAGAAEELFAAVCVQALYGFAARLPSRFHQAAGSDAEARPFSQNMWDAMVQADLSEDPLDNRFRFQHTAYQSAFDALAQPWKEHSQQLTDFGVLDWSPSNTQLTLTYIDPTDRRYTQEVEKHRAALGTWQLPFEGTPLFPLTRDFLFKDVAIPFELPLQERFRHQWLVGAHGTGKTTILSAQIIRDLDGVSEGKCSVVLIDSQNEMLPELARLSRFGPGGDLQGKLVYLEPDPDFPLALNIFDVRQERLGSLSSAEREQLMRGVMQMTNFFLKSLVKADTSAHMDIALQYLIPAVLAIPNATIAKLKELLEPGGYQKFEKEGCFRSLDPEVRQWLHERLADPKSPGAAAVRMTLDAIRLRLDGFLADSMFRRMFRSPRSKLDLFDELQSAKVILVNTKKGLLKEGTETFGRFFIAKLLQATEERMLIGKSSRLTVFCYIDEASDYIAYEQTVADLIDKARKQKVALIVANQSEDQIRSDAVLSALHRVGIQIRALEPGKASITMRGETCNVDVRDVDFGSMQRMSAAEWQTILDDMHERYATRPQHEPAATGEPDLNLPSHQQERAADAATADSTEPSGSY